MTLDRPEDGAFAAPSPELGQAFHTNSVSCGWLCSASHNQKTQSGSLLPRDVAQAIFIFIFYFFLNHEYLKERLWKKCYMKSWPNLLFSSTNPCPGSSSLFSTDSVQEQGPASSRCSAGCSPTDTAGLGLSRRDPESHFVVWQHTNSTFRNILQKALFRGFIWTSKKHKSTAHQERHFTRHKAGCVLSSPFSKG